jgi:thiol-disulfide isomerase/thioredoxin
MKQVMKKLFLLLTLTVFVFSSFGQGIVFEKNMTIEQAIEKAKAENKYVFVDIYTSWCGPCKMMEKQVFPMKEVGDYFNSRFVNLKMNAEVGEEGPKFANKYGVKAYPTFVMLNGNGELAHMFAGGFLDLGFIDKVADSFDNKKAFGVLKRRYESGERDPKLVASYLKTLMNTNTTNVTEMVDELYGSLNDKEKINEECLFVFDKFARVGSDREVFLRNNINKFRKVADNDKINEIVKKKYTEYFGLIVKNNSSQVTIEQLEKAADNFADYKLSDPGNVPAFKAAAQYKLTREEKENCLKIIKNSASKVTENEKNLMLYIVIPGLHDLLSDKEEEELMDMVTNDKVKGYIIRQTNR